MTTQVGSQRVGSFLKRYSDWIVGIGVLGLMVTLIIPIAPGMLDILLATNITMSLLLLLVTMNVRGAAEISTFPTILLFATLLRLGLNVASTRLILTGGKAGAIITAFGEYVGGENLTVGMIIFLILIIIQFVVITKGSGRVSEVAARFVLDAMPGKQMAIDADLNGGVIDSEEAKFRREEVATEAEFYGAMDGASKFVRGDAIAGLIITCLNLVGGISIGMMSGMDVATAGKRFSMLTIGDGLVSQIPALLISTAAAVVVTKNTSKASLGHNLLAQVSGRPKATLIAAGMLFAMGMLPGMPRTPFFVLGASLAFVWRSTRDAESASALMGDEPELVMAAEGASAEADEQEDSIEDLLVVDRIALEIGYRLIPLVQDKSGTGILDHIAQLRRRFALREGVVVPPVRIKDNIRLGPNAYRVLLSGQEIAAGEIEPDLYMAMDGGSVIDPIEGRETTDPAFGLPARWVKEELRDEAEVRGYTVIDPTSVLVTHLAETLRDSIGEILTRDDVKELVEAVKKNSPAIVEELTQDKASFGDIQAVLRSLLKEGVPIRNMPAILEVIADNLPKIKDPEGMSELVRQRLGRVLCEMHSDTTGTVHAITLDPDIESRLATAVGGGEPGAPSVNPAYLQSLMERIGESVGLAAQGGKDVVLLVRSNVRRFLNELVRASLPKLSVLSYNEVVPARAVETQIMVRMEE